MVDQIANYTDLINRMSDLVGESINATSYPVLIQLFEACANRRLRVQQQLTQTALTPSAAGLATLPTDFLKQKSVVWTGITPYVELKKTSWARIQSTRYLTTQSNGLTSNYAIQNTSIRFAPVDSLSATVNLEYYQKIPALTALAPTNWVITAYPDLYLFGSLVELEMMGGGDERAANWKGRRDEVFEEIMVLSAQEEEPDDVREDEYF